MFVRILIGVGIFLVVAFIGLITQFIGYRKRLKCRNFIVEYSNTFNKFLINKDSESYDYLLRNMNKAQVYLGYNGQISGCKPSSPIYQRSFPVLSLLTDIREEQISGYYLDSSLCIQMIQTSLSRTIGDYDNNFELIIKQAKNIFIDFFKGFNWIISIPFIALSYMFTGRNIFQGNVSRPIKMVWRVISLIIQLISVASGIMSIVLGYQDFLILIKSWF